MTAGRRQRIEAVALEALGRTAAERAAYLDVACADDAGLRRDVESLLAGQGEAAVMLESPPWASAASQPSPPLAPGTRLGPYEIESALGVGGMGEVYKGRDTRLGRTVAIKVLPPQLASDPERRRRFEQEARAVSALNHPHICPLFDLGEAVVSNPESRTPNPEPIHYLVLAHLEGQTLAARLAKGPLTVTQVLDVGAQIADALSAAHRAGILHRDLKPANVMLTKGDGGSEGRSGLHAMLLDFGLAKLAGLGEQPAIALDSGSGDGRGPVTARGTVLGTAPYMAPEQIEGKPADARADLWALGAVLYEMLAGRRAFAGDTPATLMAAILEHEPAPLASLQPRTPPALARVVTKCLAKNPEDRWDSAHDAADELRWISQTTATGADRPWRPGPRLVAAAVAGALLIFAAGAGITWVLRPAEPVVRARVSLDVRPASELNAGGASRTSYTLGGSRTALAWTPDGQALVFVGRRNGVQQLYVRRLDDAEGRPLAGTEGAQAPAVSHDGQWVAFWSAGAIRKVPIGGGPAMDLAPGVTEPPRGMAWDAGGGLLFGRDDDRIWQVAPGGVPAAVTTLGEAEVSHALPCPLPGGWAFVYTARRRQWSWGGDEIVVHTIATGMRTVLLKDAVDARYLPSGHLVFMRRGTLFAVPFDAGRLEVQGPAVAVLETVVQALTSSNTADVTGAGQFAVAPTGALAWVRGPVMPYPASALVTVNRRGQVTPLPVEPRSYGQYLRLSPDGRRLAVVVRDLTEVGLWIYDLGRETFTPLARGGEAVWPVWSPDGRRLAFDWLLGGRQSLMVQLADGTTAPQPLVAGAYLPSSWSPDGRHLAGMRSGDIVVATVDGDRPDARALIETPHTEQWPAISQDGRWLAYGSNVSGRDEVYVRPYPGPGAAEQVSIDGGNSPAWNPRGTELFFVSPPAVAAQRTMQVVEISGGRPPGSARGGPNAVERPRIGRPRPLFQFDGSSLRFYCLPVRCYDVSVDGQHFYVTQRPPVPPRQSVSHIDLILNWTEEVKAKVRAK